jgi:hypothetical protein
MKVLVDVARQLAAALDPAAKGTTAPDFRAEFDRVAAASANVTRFTTEQCGVTLDSGSSGAPATAASGRSSSG